MYRTSVLERFSGEREGRLQRSAILGAFEKRSDAANFRLKAGCRRIDDCSLHGSPQRKRRTSLSASHFTAAHLMRVAAFAHPF
jgi:hypothetical protein